MTAPIVLVSRFPVTADAPDSLADALHDGEATRYLVDAERTEILQLRAFDGLGDFAAGAAALSEDWERFAEHMTGDVRRELLTLVETPKPISTPLPQTDFVQLRHVEVPPSRMSAYRAWRDETIFAVVRESVEVEIFLAYHSIVSGQPGVMFIAGFSGDPERYRAVFDSDRYRDIVRQAGDSYITGGTDGLYTRLYERVTARAA